MLEFLTDPEVPTLPPHITLEQAKTFAAAIAKGDSGSRQIISQSLKQKVQGLLPRS